MDLPDVSSLSKDRLLLVVAQQAVKIVELENETKTLREDLSRTTRLDSSENDVAVLRQAHAALQAEHAQCEARFKQMDEKYVRAKEGVLQWHTYINRHFSPRSKVKREAPAAPSSARPSLQTTSSQSTVIDPELAVTQPAEDDFVPEVVKERQIKRRKITPRIKTEPGTVEQPFIIHTDEDEVPTRRLETQLSDLDAGTTPRPAPKTSKNQSPAKRTAEAAFTPRRPLGTIDANRSIQRKNLKDSFLSDGKKEKTLRSRPVETLQLGDFVPNILYNGPQVTFVDVADRETTRVCQPGCTRVACCGNKYRKMVELGGAQVSGKTDAEALEHYLGARWKDTVRMYGPQKYDDLVLQAHAMAFAEQAGAQTRNMMRAKTPPGFWRMDMPSTQELNEQNREAEKEERRRIAERYHEAMRENGSWMFADEV